MKTADSQAAALIAAGRLLQSGSWPSGRVKIDKRAGETYPQAVARNIAGLEAAERNQLRNLVSWVREYERQETGDRSRSNACPAKM